MRRFLPLLFSVFFLVTGCSSVTVVPHPDLGLTPGDASAFLAQGCIQKEGLSSLNCSALSLDPAISCESFAQASYMGALTPQVSIIECAQFDRNFEGIGLHGDGCMMPVGISYLVAQGPKILLLDTPEKFAEFFGPVESPEEAIAFAHAMTGDYPDFDASFPDGYEAYVDTWDSTYVDVSEEGYKVHLFSYGLCGCGPHNTIWDDSLVHTDGTVEFVDSEPIYHDPAEDGLCVD